MVHCWELFNTVGTNRSSKLTVYKSNLIVNPLDVKQGLIVQDSVALQSSDNLVQVLSVDFPKRNDQQWTTGTHSKREILGVSRRVGCVKYLKPI